MCNVYIFTQCDPVLKCNFVPCTEWKCENVYSTKDSQRESGMSYIRLTLKTYSMCTHFDG